MTGKDTARSPRVGYDTPEKQHYRQRVWDALLPAWREASADDRAHILLMPSREGLEIGHVISLGIPEDRIIAIDESAAVIATSLWRKKYPRVKFFASTVGECAAKIKKTGAIIAAANLDFCSNFSDELVGQFGNFIRDISRFDSARLAVSIAKGREGKALTRMINLRGERTMQAYEEPRMAALMLCAGLTHQHIVWAQGGYVSGRMPMAWAVVSPTDYIEKRMIAAHIAELAAYDPAHEAAVFLSTHRGRYHRGWWISCVADKFSQTLWKAQKGIVLAGGKSELLLRYPDLENAADAADKAFCKALSAAETANDNAARLQRRAA